jgi:D-alanyl-D-alanine carboxypeptidase
MRRLLPVLLVLSLALPAAARSRAVAAPTPLVVPKIESIAAAALERVPGLAIAVRKGNAYFSKGWGELDLEAHVPVRSGSVFQIASVTKQFTGAAIARLAEQGKVNVDDSVRRFLPELDGRFEPITIRHLLNHTSGITDHLGQVDTLYEPKTQQEVLALIMSRPPYEPAGVRFSYSNAGYYLLGMVIERASNMTYAQYLRTAFFEPLQMADTSYCGTNAPVPVGYGSDPRNGEFFEYPAMHVDLLYAAGGLCSSATDLLLWNRALANGLAVSPDSYVAMTRGFDAWVGAQYGYGLIADRYRGHRRTWHNGMIYGFESHVAHFPDDDLTIVVLINWYALRDRATDIAEEVARAMFQ